MQDKEERLIFQNESPSTLNKFLIETMFDEITPVLMKKNKGEFRDKSGKSSIFFKTHN